jgi:two-component system, sensor histidine kinase RegB
MLMTHEPLPVLSRTERSSWLRLRTLIFLRWLTVLGQSSTVLVVAFGLRVDLPLAACFAVIAAAAAFNLGFSRFALGKRRLSEVQSTVSLAFDLCQLGALLYLTGGLANPFALFLLAPVTISASVLSLRATVFLGLVGFTIITLLAVDAVPLVLATGDVLALSPHLTVGTWASLTIGTVFLALYARQVTGETFSMSQALAATQLALVREQQMTAIGGKVAAAAHELGTPLATIKLAAAELQDDLDDRPEQREDARLIATQADRCRDILRALSGGESAAGLAGAAPFSWIAEEAAEPHARRGVRIIVRAEGRLVEEAPVAEPKIARLPEIVQGLRNLVQNAVDFAHSCVWIDLDWSPEEIRVTVGDDGPGYPPDLIEQIGDPFLRSRTSADRPGYEGMGLGLFIAKTLLERTGATLSFGNGSTEPRTTRIAGPAEFSRPPGALATVTWARRQIEAPENERVAAGSGRALPSD